MKTYASSKVKKNTNCPFVYTTDKKGVGRIIQVLFGTNLLALSFIFHFVSLRNTSLAAKGILQLGFPYISIGKYFSFTNLN